MSEEARELARELLRVEGRIVHVRPRAPSIEVRRDALADGDVSLRLTLSPLEARQLANAVERLGSHPQVRASASRLASALRKAAFVLETPPADRPAPPVVDRLEARIRRDIEAERGAPWPIR